jgi:hypothetical protein
MSAYEQRMTFRLLSYWNKLKGEREIPSIKEVNITELGEVWGFCFTICLDDEEKVDEFQYFGAELVALTGVDLSGLNVEKSLPGTMMAQLMDFYPQVILLRSPVSKASKCLQNGCEILYRSLIVPFSSDGNKVDFLMGTTNFRQNV